MSKYAEDIMGFIGLGAMSGGVYLEFGLGWALIAGGLPLVVLAILLGRSRADAAS